VDDLFRQWLRGRSRFVDEDAAEAASDAFDWTVQLKDKDYQDLLGFVRAFPGGAENEPSDFDFTDRDLTFLEGEERLLADFATNVDLALELAWWVASMNPPAFNAIRDRLGISSIEGSEMRVKADELNANLNYNQTWDVV
jgi:hypothetical protein